MLMEGNKSILQYWLTDGSRWPTLQSICIKLFTIATSSAASERNFSAMGFIHSKLRNRLAASTLEKVIYVRSNLSAVIEDYEEQIDSDEYEGTTSSIVIQLDLESDSLDET
jgi:hypothetical protein